MKYYLFLIITLLSVKNAFAQSNVADKSNCILDLRNNKVLLIGNDTIKPQKKDNIFCFPVTTDIIIGKVMLPDTAKTSHSFKVTLNGELVGKETKDKKSHDQDIQLSQYNVYTIYWGNLNWKICCTDEYTKKFDLVLLDTTKISIRTINSEIIEKRNEKGFFELNDTLTINSAKFPKEGLLSIICNGDTILHKEVQRIEDNFGFVLYKGKKYIFELEGNIWYIGIEEETSASDNNIPWQLKIAIIVIILFFISYELFRVRESIKRIFIRIKSKKVSDGNVTYYKSKNETINIGTFAYPNGFHKLMDGRTILVEGDYVKLIFSKDCFTQKDLDNNDITIECKKDKPNLGDAAYPNGVFFMPDNTIIFVDAYRIKDIKIIETKEENNNQGIDVSEEIEKIPYNWLSSLTDDTKKQLESIKLKIEEFNSCDQLCSELVKLVNSIKKPEEFKPQNDNPEKQQKSEDELVQDFIKDMKKKSNIRIALKEKCITTKTELIEAIDSLLIKSKPNEVSYTLGELSTQVEKRPLPEIDDDLISKVLNVYLRRYLNNKFNLDWNEKTVLSNAITGIKIIKSTEIKNMALEIIGNIVGLKFKDEDDFLSVWKDKTTNHKPSGIENDYELINRLKHLANSKNKTINEILGEIEKPQSADSDTQEEILINGKSVDDVKKDLSEYENIRSLSELTKYGKTAKDIENNLYNNGQRDFIESVQNAVRNGMNMEEVDPFKNLKRIVEKMIKADTAEKIVSAVGEFSTIVEEMSSLVKDKNTALSDMENAIREKETAKTLIINEVKSHYQNLFKEDLSSEDPTSAIDILIGKVKEKISKLEKDIDKKEIINNEKDKEIQALCQDYSNLMSTAFEKIEKDLVRTCKNAKTTDGLATKFIQRVINNDAFGVDGFMEELKSIINNPTFNHEKVQTSLKELFLDAVQNNSWIQTLSHIYLYVQNPQVASYFTQNKIDVRCINSSFILTEQMLRALGIELHYPILFEDIYDSNLYDESTLSDVKDYVNDVKELVGDRQGVIIDMFRLGYTANGETHKAKVTRFN